MSLHKEIEAFLERTHMSATRFGRLAAGDPRLVGDLRQGRVPGPVLAARVRAFLAAPPAWQPARRGGATSARASNAR
ncbi:hypothetical protein [Sphingomonas sp. TDK1]|uniref:hypothetical protein n=1 Tax=Sphingomonas sp. TDK1 TaxID=453247 RepID=UPI0007D96EFC|nr:hypothetical protein [Sphingomonas sp. TDK1]OAN58896.1 hypothetical protein A7X12_04290 [Sphingomonas sp. TDK1]